MRRAATRVRPIDCKVAVYHGWEDPFAKPEDVVALAAELTEAGADWQVQAFGHAYHAFMAPQANSPERGIQYSARAAARLVETGAVPRGVPGRPVLRGERP